MGGFGKRGKPAPPGHPETGKLILSTLNISSAVPFFLSFSL
jgi:hypothetical protein